MTATIPSGLLDLLKSLSTEPGWLPGKLPKAVTLDVLRLLDHHGLIELKSNMLGWYSPEKMPHVGGVMKTALERGFPVRVSEVGKAELTRVEMFGGDANKGEGATGADKPQASERDVAGADWLAETVRELAFLADVRDVLFPRVIQWIDGRTTILFRQQDRWRRALLHCATRALKKPRLRNEEAGPPHRGWVFEHALFHLAIVVHAMRESGIQATGGAWVPRQLARSNKPRAEDLVPLPRRALTEIETCTLVAALIDAAEFGGVEKIGQFDGDDGTPVLRRTEWGFIVKNVRTLEEERDGGAVTAAVSAVRALLRPAGPQEAPPACRHSDDFRSVVWHGIQYSFTNIQARVVAVLYANWENGTPDVGMEFLLESANCRTSRLADVFRNNPAWGTMIVDGATKGSKRLSDPPDHS